MVVADLVVCVFVSLVSAGSIFLSISLTLAFGVASSDFVALRCVRSKAVAGEVVGTFVFGVRAKWHPKWSGGPYLGSWLVVDGRGCFRGLLSYPAPLSLLITILIRIPIDRPVLPTHRP